MTKGRILIVEDNNLIALEIETHLDYLDYEIVGTVAYGEKVLAQVEATNPELVLMDVRLKGGVDGIQAARMLREKGYHIPIIYITAHADESTITRAKPTQPVGYLEKPFTMSTLKLNVEMALSRHRLQEVVRAKDRQYRLLFEQAAEAILIVDKSADQIIDANPQAYNLLGYSSNELTQLSQIIPLSLQADNPLQLERLYENGMVRHERVLQHKNQQLIPVEVNACLFAEQYIMAFVRDISAQKLWQERLESIYRLGYELTSLRDEEAIIWRVLETAFTLLHFDLTSYGIVDAKNEKITLKYHFVEGRKLERLFMIDINDKRSVCAQVVRERKSKYVPDLHEIFDKYVTITGHPFRSELCIPLIIDKQLIGVLNGEMKDIDAFSPVEQTLFHILGEQLTNAVENARFYQLIQEQIAALERSQNQLVQAEKLAAMGRLGAGLAHEINNPLQAATSFVALSMEEIGEHLESPLLADIYENLSIANKELLRVSQLVKSLRDFYQWSPTNMMPINVCQLMQEALTIVGSSLRKKNIKVNLDCQQAFYVQGIGNRLQQVFVNILLNAQEAIEMDGRVQIDVHKISIEGEAWLRLSFQDTGSGIETDDLGKIYEPFFTTKTSHIGLGLAISHAIIQAHNGRIMINSEVEKGTVVKIELPMLKKALPIGEKV
ncbi:MAG TPA: ATP-binding protein [Anaerolineae bacterium]|nr:ATP-binding protein [Anaerolineae bacterium]